MTSIVKESIFSMEIDKNCMCFYLSPKHIECDNFVDFLHKKKAYLLLYTDYDEKTVMISAVYVPEELRSRGCATKLLKSVQKWSNIWGAKKVTLDDCSENFNKKDNVYLKCGFKYMSKNEPEMSWIPKK